jgi:hypothetical protein
MTSDSALAIEANGLVTFGETRAVDGVDLAVRRVGLRRAGRAGRQDHHHPHVATLLRPDEGWPASRHDIVREAGRAGLA